MRLVLRHGDCVARMAEMEPESIDVLCCDPPYFLEFMGAKWDSVARSRDYKPRTDKGYGDKGILPHYGRGGSPQDRDRFKRNSNQAAQGFHQVWLREAYRVLVPGGVLKAFSGTRTHHRLAVAMEAVGLVLDPKGSLEAWAYGSGFPKSLNIGGGWGTAFKPGWEPVLVGYKPAGGLILTPPRR